MTGETSREGEFVEYASRSVMRTGTPEETPISVQVINQDFIKRSQAQTIGDALAWVSGTSVSSTMNGLLQASVRGSFASTKTDGVGDSEPLDSLQVQTAGVERLGVVEGAASILSGALVNVQLKPPTARTMREASAQVGTYGNLLSALNLSGTAAGGAALTYRLVMSAERTDRSFGVYEGMRSYYAAPGGTEVVAGYQYARKEATPLLLARYRDAAGLSFRHVSARHGARGRRAAGGGRQGARNVSQEPPAVSARLEPL